MHAVYCQEYNTDTLTFCSVLLQCVCVAVCCCSVSEVVSLVECPLVCTAHIESHHEAMRRSIPATHRNTLQHSATHCNALQHTATHCNTVQRTATHCNTLQHTATHCNTLQHTATHCNTLQHTVSHRNTTHHTAHCTQTVPTRQQRLGMGWLRLVGSLRL